MRLQTLLLSIVLLTTNYTSAQMAPDFLVTDIEGHEHQLYADYLDQGKTVMIKVFFTTCPPCNSIAPLMEPFYQEWGAGAYDVEFFEMTDKTFDVNSLVAEYTTNYGSTFPAISMQGGSIAAVQPYKDNQFGPWTGTPTFIVIAPNGEVDFDVSGNGNQGTINAIDAAIAATGAVKPNQVENPVSILGNIQFMSGSAGVNGAYVQVIDTSGNIIIQDTSAINGGFNLQILLSEVQPDWQVRVVKQGNPTNGVNAADLIRIQKHLLFIEPFTDPLHKIAADANGSWTVSSLDIVTLLKLLLGITPGFPNEESWITIPADTDFGPPTQHPTLITSFTIPLADILSGARQPAFIAIKKGDVTGNADPN